MKVRVQHELNFLKAKKIAMKMGNLLHKELGPDLVTAMASASLLYECITEVFIERFGKEEYERISGIVE